MVLRLLFLCIAAGAVRIDLPARGSRCVGDNIAEDAMGKFTFNPNKKKKVKYPIDEWGADFQSEHERYLVEKKFKKPARYFAGQRPAESSDYECRMYLV